MQQAETVTLPQPRSSRQMAVPGGWPSRWSWARRPRNPPAPSDCVGGGKKWRGNRWPV